MAKSKVRLNIFFFTIFKTIYVFNDLSRIRSNRDGKNTIRDESLDFIGKY